ncbi:hypothetical protein PDJ95_29915 [Bacillus cereus]|nr:hypothetical protein [Bacillus cereus]
MIGLGNNKPVSYTKKTLCGNDNWIIYPLDSGKYIIANLLYEGVLDIQYRNKEFILYMNKYMSLPQQHWSLETVDTHLAYYKIRNLDIGMIIGKNIYDNTIYVNNINTDDINYHWTFEEAGDIYLPTKPRLEQIDKFPQYTNQNDDLPIKTKHQLVGWTLLPSIMMQDIFSLKQQLQKSPYYILEKYQYWMKLHDVSLLPKEKRTLTYTCGITETIQNSLTEQIGITIQIDSGVSFLLNSPGGMYPIKKQIIRDLKMSESQTVKKMIAKTAKVTYQNPFISDFLYCAKYILTTELILKHIVQSNKESNIEINQWIYTDPQIIQTTIYSKSEKIE